MTKLQAEGIRSRFDARTGLLDGFVVADQGREVAPLHIAPWVGTDEVMPEDAAPLMATLGGDFFCAPFASSEGDSPVHGWPPNSTWTVEEQEANRIGARLRRTVHGARVTKELSVLDGHPFVYQSHVFTGGTGQVTVSNHANVSVLNGALIRTSRKRCWETPGTPQESALVYPAQSPDPRQFPGLNGPVDLTTYPWKPRHEDFVVGVEAPGHRLGWVAVTRPEEADLFLSLRDPRRLPMSMFWHSNGGRDYPPWSGRHVGCLGVEEGAARHMLGISGEPDLVGPGALALEPGGRTEVRHVIGALAWPYREAVADIRIADDRLVVRGEGGAERSVPLDSRFLDQGDGP